MLKQIKRTSLTLLTLSLLLVGTPSKAAQESGLVCELVPTLTQYLLKTHLAVHVQTEEINRRTAEQFIKRVDPSKTLLMKSDVSDLQPKVLAFLKTMKEKPNCTEFLKVKDTLIKRSKEQLEYTKEVLGASYKLDENVELQLDPEKREFAANDKEYKARQLAQIHFQVSNYLLADTKMAKAKKQLIHRYELIVKRMEELTPSDIYTWMVNAFTAALDPHSNYLGPADTEDFRINMNLSLEGIGASLSSEDGFTVIQELIPGGSAIKSNQLQAKDKIISVGQGKSGEMENVIDMDLKDVVRKIRGQSGSTVRLMILREKPEVTRFPVTLVRSKVNLEDDAAKIDFYEKKIDDKKYKLARIELPGFYGGQGRNARTSYGDMAKLVEKANKDGADGLLLDLSSNSGGLLDEAVKIAGLFINQGNIVATKDSEGEVDFLDDIDTRVQFAGPVVVLISRLSASASEIVAGALQDYKRAIIVGGDHTYGKGSVQAVLPLQEDFGILKVTTGLFYIPGGNSTQHRGVTADISYPNPFSTDDIGEKWLDYSLKPDAIKPFLSKESNSTNLWKPVLNTEIEKLKILSDERVKKNDKFAEIVKELNEAKSKKGLIKLSSLRGKESTKKKEDKDKAPKELAKERNAPQIDEAINILSDFVHMRKQGSDKLLGKEAKK
ncbi:MAG: S41 family peptidase [Oligoflexia bacterium]|nr:S41 family peptidase [Oligoflexia bacterium]